MLGLCRAWMCCRVALRCADLVMTQKVLLDNVAPLQVSAELRAAVLARGDPRVAATILATQQLPGSLQEQARSPYQLSGTPSAPTQMGAAAQLSALDAVQEFAQTLTKPGVTRHQLLWLLSTAGSLGSPSVAFYPPLSTAFIMWLGRMSEECLAEKDEGLWCAAAVAQVHLTEAAGGDEQLAAMLLGSGATEQEFLRCVCLLPVQQGVRHMVGRSSRMHAHSVCQTSWCSTKQHYSAQGIKSEAILQRCSQSTALHD